VALKISIVTACFNSSATIHESLASVASQTYKNIEHIIVDGASKDDTLNIVKSGAIPGAVIISEPDRGIYDAWNKGIRRATGDYIWLLNSDDQVYDPDTVKDAADFLRAHNNPPFMYGKVRGYEQATGYSYIAGKPTHLGDFVYGMTDFCILSTVVRKDTFQRIGYFNTGYRISSDYDWAINLFKQLPMDDIVFYDRILTNFSVGGVSNQRYRQAYAEVASIVRNQFPYGKYLLHRVYSGWRLGLMSLIPYARAIGLLSAWRSFRRIAKAI